MSSVHDVIRESRALHSGKSAPKHGDKHEDKVSKKYKENVVYTLLPDSPGSDVASFLFKHDHDNECISYDVMFFDSGDKEDAFVIKYVLDQEKTIISAEVLSLRNLLSSFGSSFEDCCKVRFAAFHCSSCFGAS